MQLDLIIIALTTLVGGALVARRLQVRRHQSNLAKRLQMWDETSEGIEPETVLKPKAALDDAAFPATNAAARSVEILISRSGEKMSVSSFVTISVALLLFPLAIDLIFNFNSLVAAGVGLILCVIPAVVLHVKRLMRRTKFITQLPDAIDLMISILRSGHSIPQAVKTISDESPSPCGEEFNEVMQRMNLGQPLSEALAYSCQKYQSIELDLLRRAVSIQSEVGGSLAELLDKTNSTLRQRLKLVRHVRVLTTQSKMTAIIVGLLPICMAIGLQILSPNYLLPLFDTRMGNLLLFVAIVLQVFGIALMNKMATVKV